MKNAEDEAFDELAKRQGGGFKAKQAMAADKLQEPAQEPVAWAVQGCSKMWRGEFAEIDAKAEAKRIGGTCVAYALHAAPPQRPWVGLTDAEHETLWVAIRATGYLTKGQVDEVMEIVEAKLKERNHEH